jgi:putative phosphoribosyl transferase
VEEKAVKILAGETILDGDLRIPQKAIGIVVFAHGSGSSRLSRRNLYVAELLQQAGLATLLFDLLTPQEAAIDAITRQLRFDIDFLSHRLMAATDWIIQDSTTRDFPIGYFGASTGAAAALMASVRQTGTVKAIVSRGGRPDMAESILASVDKPVLLIVGSLDVHVIELNRQVLACLNTTKELAIVEGAGHLFEEPGTLHEAACLARNWFLKYLVSIG